MGSLNSLHTAKWFRRSLLAVVILLPLMVTSTVGVTLVCGMVGVDPGRIIKGWLDGMRQESQKQEGRLIMAQILDACPKGMEGWSPIPYRNDLEGDGYTLLWETKLQYNYRQPDGSDNLNLSVIVNPATSGMHWYNASPYVPIIARPMSSLPRGALGWLHQTHSWNFYLPDYDRKPGDPKACIALIYIGDWRRTTLPKTELENPNPILLANLIPMFMVPASLPDTKAGSLNPHCIALQIVGRNEAAVMTILRQINVQQLSIICEKR